MALALFNSERETDYAIECYSHQRTRLSCGESENTCLLFSWFAALNCVLSRLILRCYHHINEQGVALNKQKCTCHASSLHLNYYN